MATARSEALRRAARMLGTGVALLVAGALVDVPLGLSLQAVLGPNPSVLERRPAGDDVRYESELVLRPNATGTIEVTLGPGDVGYAVASDGVRGPGRVLRFGQNPAIPAGWFDLDPSGKLTPLGGSDLALPAPRAADEPAAVYSLQPAALRAALGATRPVVLFTVGHYTDLRVPADALSTRNIALVATLVFFVSGFMLRRARHGAAGASLSPGRLWLVLPFWTVVLGLIVPVLPRPLQLLLGGGGTVAVWAAAFWSEPRRLTARAALRAFLGFLGFLAVLVLVGFGTQHALRDPGGDRNVVAKALRDVPASEREPHAGRLLVLCVGSSSTEAETYSPEFRASWIWTAILERELATRFPERAVRVVNLGKGATTSTYGLRLLEGALQQVRPDWVVIDYVHNDWVLDLLNGTVIDWLARAGLDLPKPREVYRRNLVAMVERSRAAGGRPLLVLEPTYATYLTGGLGLDGGHAEQLEPFYRIVRDVGRELDAPVVDGNQPFVADRGTRFEPFQDDSVHFNAWGHQQMAEFLAGVVAGPTTAP